MKIHNTFLWWTTFIVVLALVLWAFDAWRPIPLSVVWQTAIILLVLRTGIYLSHKTGLAGLARRSGLPHPNAFKKGSYERPNAHVTKNRSTL